MLILLLMVLSLVGCGGGDSSGDSVQPTVEIKTPLITGLWLENVSPDGAGYRATEGVTVGIKDVLYERGLYDVDSFRFYWTDHQDRELVVDRYLELTDRHLNGVKACAEAKLKNGKAITFCSSLIKVEPKPVLADYLQDVYVTDLGDHFNAIATWKVIPDKNDWRIQWYDDKDTFAAKGENYYFKNIKTAAVKACVYDLKNKKCILYSKLKSAPDYQLPELDRLSTYPTKESDKEVLKLTYRWSGISSGWSHNTYRWLVNGIEQKQSTDTFEIKKKDIGKRISVCLTGYFKNYRTDTLTPTKEYCSKAKTYYEQDIDVSYDYDPIAENYNVGGLNYVISGVFNGVFLIKKEDFEVFVNNQLLSEGRDYQLTVSGSNHFKVDIHEITKNSSFAYGCYFSYMGKRYSCTQDVGAEHYPINTGFSSRTKDFSQFISGSFSYDLSTSSTDQVKYLRCRPGDNVTWYIVSPTTGAKTKLEKKRNGSGNAFGCDFFEETFIIEPKYYGKKLFVTVENRNGQHFEYNFEDKVMGPKVTTLADRFDVKYDKKGKLSMVTYQFCNIGDIVIYQIVSPLTGAKSLAMFNSGLTERVKHGTCQDKDASWWGSYSETGNKLLVTVETLDGTKWEYDFGGVLIGSTLDL
ncbi:hypothetical protein [Photobacterium sanguinicancri]|uniref:hypothetical protein n=1 Tax=Photobacterium sanguinicancri TaxID=875932 RepID=UPI003D0E1621